MSFGKEQNFMPDKILIVDDETEIADLIEVYLKNEEYTVFKFYRSCNFRCHAARYKRIYTMPKNQRTVYLSRHYANRKRRRNG